MSNDVFHFGDYELNGSERILRRGGERVALEPKALDLLLYLAQHRDRAVDKEELQDTIWAGAIVTETSLTRAVMKARRAVGDDSDMQAVIRTVHGHGYQFIARLAGPETPAPLPRGEPTAPSSPLRGWVVAGGLGALAALAVLGLYQLFAGDPSAPPPVDVEKSIAVLPFTNRSAAEENAEFFAAGVHDDVLTLLSKLSDLRVISRTSVQRYQDTELTMREIGTALGVATVVEGAVQRAGNRVRMNVQLINTRTDEHLWAETYDRQLSAGNVFQIQSEIARAIATALQAELSPVEERALARAPTANLAALYAYQRGRQAFDRTTGASLEKAKGYYEQALALDPNFAEAYVGLAFTYIYLPTFGAMASDEGYGQARELIDRALELDPDQGEAYTARAIIASRGRLAEESLDAMRQAIALNPNSSLVHVSYALQLNRMGRGAEALPIGERAIAIDPLYSLAYLVHGDSYESLGRFDEALRQYQRTVDIDPTSQRGYASVGDLYFETGDLVEGVRWTRRALALGPGEPWLYSRLARLYTDLGDDKTAGEMLGRAISLSPDGALTHYTLALRHLRNGEEGPAREYAQLLRGRLLSQGLQLLRVLDLRHGRIEAARARYEARYPDLFTDAARVDGQNYRAAIDVAGILLRAGQDAAARTLLVGAWEATRGLPVRGQYGKNLADVEILALQGRQVEAIAALRAAVADGWRMRWWLRTELNPNLDGLRDGQAYQSIVQMLHADMAEQRRAIEALAAAGELEPLPETSL
jgi:TolB-like protein/DNA-binding winged helix-turn-helix (wHTH) protein/Tfp pilus assembly protein PilF